jgi:penicillin amidase
MLDEQELLGVLRGTTSIEAICTSAGISRATFYAERDAYLRRRLPPSDIRLRGGVTAPVTILRDRRGIPHIYAQTDNDLQYGLGLAMAQDRLWQLDCFRRRGQGRLAEHLGPSYLSSDTLYRTLDLQRTADREAARLDEATNAAVCAFVAGINHGRELFGRELPIEFVILGYEPEPWQPADVITALRGFWWVLNGRLASLTAAEAIMRYVHDPALREAWLTPEFDDERIVPAQPAPIGGVARWPGGADNSALGSNNWAIDGRHSASGAGLLASDPHQGFMLPSNWYECRLSGPHDDAAGAAWAGVPGLLFGSNKRIAWGLTNNNTSTRDLYTEERHPTDPGRYRNGAHWQLFEERLETIRVRGQAAHQFMVQRTVRGTIVNHLLQPVAPEGDPPLALRWVGHEHSEDLRGLLALSRAETIDAFRAAVRGWAVPVFNWVVAEANGRVGYQCAGRIPIRGRATRGYRDARASADYWLGYVPNEAMPHLNDPADGFVCSANGAPVVDDYPYVFSGAFASGDRTLRIRQRLRTVSTSDRAFSQALQHDTYAPRAALWTPLIVQHLQAVSEPAAATLTAMLDGWDYHYEPEAHAPTVFEMFVRTWNTLLSAHNLPAHVQNVVNGLGSAGFRALAEERADWLGGDFSAALRVCAQTTLTDLQAHFGSDPAAWRWGNVHTAHFRHPLSTPATADCFDCGPHAVSGGAGTLRNTGLGTAPLFGAASGAEYLLVVDLAEPERIYALQNIGQSGMPGSPYYADQFQPWTEGAYHEVAFARSVVEAECTAIVELTPDQPAS